MPTGSSGRGARSTTLWILFLLATLGLGATAAAIALDDSSVATAGLTIGAVSLLMMFVVSMVWSGGPRRLKGGPAEDVDDPLPEPLGASDPPEEPIPFSVDKLPEPERPPARAEGAWPAVTEDMFRRRQQRDRLPPGEFELPPAFRKRQEFTRDLPIVRSVFEGPGPEEAPAARPGKTRGQCSQCQTYLWAPKQRPIRLRCPKCGKVALLQA